MKKIITIFAFILCALFVVQSQSASTLPSFDAPNVQNSERQKVTINKEDDSPKFAVKDSVLTAKNLESGSIVDIYSILGAKVYTFEYKGVAEQLNLKAGIYIIRTGKTSQKIIL